MAESLTQPKKQYLEVRRLAKNPGVALEVLPELAEPRKPVFLWPDELESALAVGRLESSVDPVDAGPQELPAERLLKPVDVEGRVGASQVSDRNANALGGSSFDAGLENNQDEFKRKGQQVTFLAQRERALTSQSGGRGFESRQVLDFFSSSIFSFFPSPLECP